MFIVSASFFEAKNVVKLCNIMYFIRNIKTFWFYKLELVEKLEHL